MNKLIVVAGLLLMQFGVAIANVGESAVATLTFPFGARSVAMGEVGTALADDASALFFNPAGLGVRNEKWRRGSASFSFENLLPAFEIDDLWHASETAYLQSGTDLGGLGIYHNYINMGENETYDNLGRYIMTVRSHESVFALGWGFPLGKPGGYEQAAGVTVKLVNSALVPGLGSNGEGTAVSTAFDIGYKGSWQNGVCIGASLVNIGPAVWYVSYNNRDPIPQTLNVAVGYHGVYRADVAERDYLIGFSTEFMVDKELVVNHFDGNPDPWYKALFVDLFNESAGFELQEINYHWGAELSFFNTFAMRQGLLIDYLGERLEHHQGFGILLFNHIRFDLAYIYAPEHFMRHFLRQHFDKTKDGATGARDGQFQFTFTIDALTGWSEHDRFWWRENPERAGW